MKKSEATRFAILQTAFGLIYRNGYQATSVDEIIEHTNVTKGAFFYHFKSKDDMGLAMIKEVMYTGMHELMIKPLINASNPVKDIYDAMHYLLLESPEMEVSYGCPANNLIQEMAPVNKAFNSELLKLVSEWQLVLEAMIHNAKDKGRIRKDVNARQVSNFVISGYGGVRNLGKIYGSYDCYNTWLKELKRYLKNLQ